MPWPHYTTFKVIRSPCCSHNTALSCNRKCWTLCAFRTTRVTSNTVSHVTRRATWDVRREGSKQSRPFVLGSAAKKTTRKNKKSAWEDGSGRTNGKDYFCTENVNLACVYLSRYYIHFIISYIKLLLCWLHTHCMIRLGSESCCRWEQRREAERKRMVGSHRLVLASWHPNSDWPVRRPAGVGNESMSSWIVSLNSSHNVIFAVLGFCLWSQKNICDWEIRAEIL